MSPLCSLSFSCAQLLATDAPTLISLDDKDDLRTAVQATGQGRIANTTMFHEVRAFTDDDESAAVVAEWMVEIERAGKHMHNATDMKVCQCPHARV